LPYFCIKALFEKLRSLTGEKGANYLVRKFRIGPSCDNTSKDSGNDDELVVDQEHEPTSSSSLLQPNAWPDKELWEGNNAADFQASIQKAIMITCASLLMPLSLLSVMV
jgi:hypothetical protein